MMKKIFILLTMLLFSAQVWAAEVWNFPAEVALKRLKEGNERFVSYEMKHPNIDKSRRQKLCNGQRPFAVILTCSDSRVVPEIIFDQGLGDIFVIRNASNVLDEHVLGSIEYALRNLGVKLVIVLGHECCSEVGMAMKENKETPAIESIKESIKPAVTKCQLEKTYTYENVIRAHAMLTAKDILQDKDLSEYINKHDIQVIPAYYNIVTGEVVLLKEETE